MNEKVKNLIEQGKNRKKQMRDNHLRSLGLIDENIITEERKYQDFYSAEYAKFDTKTQRFYTEIHAALEVTDEEYEEICKYFPPTQSENRNTNNYISGTSSENSYISNDVETIKNWVRFMGMCIVASFISYIISQIV